MLTAKNGQQNVKIYFLVLNKYQSVTHVSTSIFQGFLFKYIVFRSVALVINKLFSILDFFTQTRLFTALYTTLWINKTFWQKIPQISIY